MDGVATYLAISPGSARSVHLWVVSNLFLSPSGVQKAVRLGLPRSAQVRWVEVGQVRLGLTVGRRGYQVRLGQVRVAQLEAEVRELS